MSDAQDHDAQHHDDQLVRAAEPIPDPGVSPHEQRPTDVDAALERRAERQVAGMFGLATVFALLFCVAYFTVDSDQTFAGWGAQNLALGLTLGLSLVLIGAGAIQWAKKLMSDHEIIEYRHPSSSSQADINETVASFQAGAQDSGLGRRTLIRNSMLGAMGALGLPMVVLLRDLGPLPGDALEHTVWKKGIRVVNDVSGEPIRASDIQIGQLVNAEPSVFFESEDQNGEVVPSEYEGMALQNAKAKAAVILVRMRPDDITPKQGREHWGVDGILCFSKICTHVGCPISLWEQQTHQLLCPCHQSTFDLANNAKVLFGPAARPLPQLQLGTDAEGYLIAMGDFDEPVGPSFWERG